MLSALLAPVAAAAGSATASVWVDAGAAAEDGDPRTVRPRALNIFGSRIGDDLLVEVTGENGTGGYGTRLERTETRSRRPSRFRLINRAPSGPATQAIEPFHRRLVVRRYFRGSPVIYYAGGFLPVTLVVGREEVEAYLAVATR